ncbi:hypothetical protein C2E23DRAFT_866859 [Lenzites betulinus]|nr:hypothetical protein C2E23DRAFT_866859 [Lenzites betulinus]
MIHLLDVTKEIKIDHDNIRDLFDRFQATTDLKQKATLANTMMREIAIHSEAEDNSVYNEYGALGLADAVAHNKEDHAQIKRLTDAADKASFDDSDYTAVVERAVTTFLAHAKQEEDEQHPRMREKLSPQRSDDLARAFLKVRKAALAREEPSAAESGDLSHKVRAGQTPVRQRLCDSVAGRDVAPLYHSHPEI